MFMFLYHLLWTLGLIFLVPITGLLRIRPPDKRDRPRFGLRFAERLALRFPDLLLEKGNIWIHALSVGEVASAVPLVNRLKSVFPGKDIVFTATTVSGIAFAREALDGKVKAVLPMPVDAWWSVRRSVRFIKPSVFILIETDIWPALLCYLKNNGIRSILVNGRVSPRTLKSYARAPFLVGKLFEPLSLCLMQSDLDRDRLLGVVPDKKRIVTIGNIKFDREMAFMSDEERQDRSEMLAVDPFTPLWVAGSTHPGEDEILLDVFEKLRPDFPLLRLILAPRDTGRSDGIKKMIQGRGGRTLLKTEVPEQEAGWIASPLERNMVHAGPPKKRALYDVLVLDTIGELGQIYGLGLVSFVGGSLVPIGGHNLLEPAGFGSPVLFGPHTHNFVSMSEALLEAGGGWQVRDGKDLYGAMKTILENAEIRNRMGASARAFVEKNGGALDRVINYVKENMPNG